MKVQDQHKIKPETQSCQTSVTSSCGSIRMSLENNEKLFDRLEDESVSIILTDPPYKYLKNQKLEVDFNEEIFFKNCKRVLKNDGFIILFGRGTSFYRWNTILDNFGFVFKEEIIWNKSQGTSPLSAITRVHETISIYCKGKGKINKVKIPYLEMKGRNIDSIIQDINRLRSIFTQESSMKAVLTFLEKNIVVTSKENVISTSISSIINTQDRCASVVSGIRNGITEKTIIRTDRKDCEKFTKYNSTTDKKQTGDRCCNVVQSVEFGLNEKTIIKEIRDHYTAIHPTQKPVRLLERLLLLVKKSDNDIVLDPFGGSFSTMEAVYNLGLSGITCELDSEYFEAGKNRILDLTSQQRMFL